MLKVFRRLHLCVFSTHPVRHISWKPAQRVGGLPSLAQVEGLGSQVNNDPAGPKARQFAVYERSQMVGPLALMFLLFRQPRPMAPMAWASQTTGPLARKNPAMAEPTSRRDRDSRADQTP